MTTTKTLAIAALALASWLLTGCATTSAPVGTRVVYQDVVKEVQRPCPVTVPVKPAPLAKPLPTDLGALVDVLTGKLIEWAGDGGYGDQATAALKTCTRK